MEDAPNLSEVLNDTEGLVWGLYYHLWKKTHKGEPCLGVNIPHTVVYQDSTPIAWYFTSPKDNKIYRKKRSNITGPSICEAMHMNQKPSPTAACSWFSGSMTFLSASPKKTRHRSSEPVYELEPQADIKEPACFKYLTKEQLQTLVAPGQYTCITESIYDGILQKFVAPREAYDHVIRAIWSPTACVCERRCANIPLEDDRQPLSDRMASFDSNTFWLSTHQPLPAGSVMVQRLTAACESIVKHLKETSAGRISVARMQLYFKVDTQNRIWLSLCNSLRLDRTVISVDRSVALNKQYSVVRDPLRHDESTRIPVDSTPFMCVLTGETCPGNQRCDVSYKLLIQDWFQSCSELEIEADRLAALDTLPPALRRANPNITRDYYLRMRAQPAFLLKTAPVNTLVAGRLTAAALQDLSRTITRPKSALADSASQRQLSRPSLSQGSAGLPGSPHPLSKSQLLGPSKRLTLMLDGAPPPSTAIDPDILYEPGATIPSALVPKSGTINMANAQMTSSTQRKTVGIDCLPTRLSAPPTDRSVSNCQHLSAYFMNVLQPNATAGRLVTPQRSPGRLTTPQRSQCPGAVALPPVSSPQRAKSPVKPPALTTDSSSKRSALQSRQGNAPVGPVPETTQPAFDTRLTRPGSNSKPGGQEQSAGDMVTAKPAPGEPYAASLAGTALRNPVSPAKAAERPKQAIPSSKLSELQANLKAAESDAETQRLIQEAAVQLSNDNAIDNLLAGTGSLLQRANEVLNESSESSVNRTVTNKGASINQPAAIETVKASNASSKPAAKMPDQHTAGPLASNVGLTSVEKDFLAEALNE